MLIEDIADHIDQCLAQRPYYACVLLVHVELRTLEAATQQLAERTGWRMLPAGRTLAGILAPTVMGRVIKYAATPIEGYMTGFTINAVILVASGLLGLLLLWPNSERARLLAAAQQPKFA